MDKPRMFKVKVEYLVTIGHPLTTADELRKILEVRAYEVILNLRQNKNIDIDVINSAVITEELP